jgi:predicted transcriptional regulator
VPRKKNSDPQLTALELEIMKVLWDHGPPVFRPVQGNLKTATSPTQPYRPC